MLAAGSLEEAEAEEAGRRRPRRSSRTRFSRRWRSAAAAEPLDLRLHRDAQSQNPGALRDKRPDGKYAPFHLYSMRQAIEEGFILDVLENYTTYKAYWRSQEDRGRSPLR